MHRTRWDGTEASYRASSSVSFSSAELDTCPEIWVTMKTYDNPETVAE